MPEVTLEIDWLGGNCPVQAEGTINGKPFYFRARGHQWSLEVGGQLPGGDAEWKCSAPYGEGAFDAGWMSEAEARMFIEQGARLYVSGEPISPLP